MMQPAENPASAAYSIGLLRTVLDSACHHMEKREFIECDAAIHTAQTLISVSGAEPIAIDDYDLDNGGVYFAGGPKLYVIKDMPPEMVIRVLSTMLMELRWSEGGYRSGLFLRYAQKTANLSGVPYQTLTS